MKTRIGRRRLLQMLGTTGAATALMPFVPRSSLAGGGGAPRRLLVIFSGMGFLEESFWPTPGASPSEFVLGSTQSVLEPLRDQLIYPDGLVLSGVEPIPTDDNAHGTGAAMAFTSSRKQSYATGPSFDQVIADHWNDLEPRSFRHIGLGVSAHALPHNACFFTGDQQPVTPIVDPQAAFDGLFGGFMDDGQDSATIARLRAERKSIIDAVRGQLHVVQGQIGSQEQEVLDAHLDHLRALEHRVVDFEAACAPPGAPPDAQDDAGRIEAQMDLVVSALACDLTQVATLQLGHCDGGISMLGLNAHDVTHAVGDTVGTAAHDGVVASHRDIDRWWADRWLYLLQKFASTPDVEGSLLDNTLVVWGTDSTTGQSYQTRPHCNWRMPYFMAGGGNWAFQTGRHITLPDPGGVGQAYIDGWTPAARLFTSILQKAGAEVDSFGNLDPGAGTLQGL